MKRLTRIAVLASAVLAAPLTGEAAGPQSCPRPAEQVSVQGLAVTTPDPLARALFEAGLTAYWAGDAAAALHAFRAAQASDPSCAMCHWGEALALGPRPGAPMAHAHVRAAWEAIIRAEGLAKQASALERELIAALRHRYGVNPMVLREALDHAWATAVDDVAATYTSVWAVQLLAAEAKAIQRASKAEGRG